MAEIFIQCGNFLMIPNQLSRLDYDTESSDLLPSCVIQFWKPILQLIVNDNILVSLIIDKILIYLTDYYRLTPNDSSVIDRERIGWIFYFTEQSSLKLDLCSIFIRLVRILQPWFAESLSQMIVRMSDDMDGTRQPLISEQKRDTLLRTVSMFANPYEYVNNEQTTDVSSVEIFPRNELYKKELNLFKKSEMIK